MCRINDLSNVLVPFTRAFASIKRLFLNLLFSRNGVRCLRRTPQYRCFSLANCLGKITISSRTGTWCRHVDSNRSYFRLIDRGLLKPLLRGGSTSLILIYLLISKLDLEEFPMIVSIIQFISTSCTLSFIVFICSTVSGLCSSQDNHTLSPVSFGIRIPWYPSKLSCGSTISQISIVGNFSRASSLLS